MSAWCAAWCGAWCGTVTTGLSTGTLTWGAFTVLVIGLASALRSAAIKQQQHSKTKYVYWTPTEEYCSQPQVIQSFMIDCKNRTKTVMDTCTCGHISMEFKCSVVLSHSHKAV